MSKHSQGDKGLYSEHPPLRFQEIRAWPCLPAGRSRAPRLGQGRTEAPNPTRHQGLSPQDTASETGSSRRPALGPSCQHICPQGAGGIPTVCLLSGEPLASVSPVLISSCRTHKPAPVPADRHRQPQRLCQPRWEHCPQQPDSGSAVCLPNGVKPVSLWLVATCLTITANSGLRQASWSKWAPSRAWLDPPAWGGQGACLLQGGLRSQGLASGCFFQSQELQEGPQRLILASSPSGRQLKHKRGREEEGFGAEARPPG